LKTSDFDYFLPPERIAQTPVEPRHASRLLVLERTSGHLEHTTFWEIGRFLKPKDLLVLNHTRVIPARLYARKLPGGGKVELLLLRRQDALTWEVLGGGKGLKEGRQLEVIGGPAAEVTAVLDGSRRMVRFSEAIEPFLATAGSVPLPPYIHTPLSDPERYQTVYAHTPGSAAAPTAGLHFTPELISHLERQGVRFVKLTLHVGLDTFAPVGEENPVEHKIHTEWCELTPWAAQAINTAHREGGRVVAVGTTSVRTLETAARFAGPGERVGAFAGSTDLFILPGYQFTVVDALVTNFHLPRSTLLMLVSDFAGRERVLDTYATAVREGYRFYSFGDAMLIL
jgi:S-adenosylmethionine:tRNA ribosyltransferase-isomerase